jgi:twinkle protein
MSSNEISPEAEAFLEVWVRENGRPGIEDTVATPRSLTSKCYAEATSRGLDVIHPTKINAQGESKEPMPGLYDMAGTAHWRNKADAALVVYRDFAEGRTIVAAKKIRRQPVCGSPGAVEFVFLGNDRRFEAVPGSYKPLGREGSGGSSPAARRPSRAA